MTKKCVHAAIIRKGSICQSALPCSRRSGMGIRCNDPMVETIDKNGYPRGCVQDEKRKEARR